MIVSVRGFTPEVEEACFIAPNASLVGNVKIGKNSSVYYGSVLRGDVNPITIGENCNIQDLCMLHATYQKTTTVLEDNVSVGHSVILHGCFVGEGTLIGMGSILMDGVKVGKSCLVGAGSLLTENSEYPEGSLILGRPARVVRALSDEERKKVNDVANYYLHYKTWHDDMIIIKS